MRRSLGTAVAALSLVVLVGCSGVGSDSGAVGSEVGVDAVAPDLDTPGDPGDAVEPERQVVTTATASLTVEDPPAAAQQVSELVESAGGRVDERSEQTASEDDAGVSRAVADLVVRVPADALTGVLADLADLGDVQSVSVSRSDQTATAVDLDARISALQTSVARLEGLLAGAATTEALLEAEGALSERQAQLESLQSQRALLADQVELSTLTLHLQTVDAAPGTGPDGFLGGLGTGWRALVSALGVVVVVLGVLLPWLVVAAVVAGVVLVLARRTRGRAAVPGPPPATDPPAAAP